MRGIGIESTIDLDIGVLGKFANGQDYLRPCVRPGETGASLLWCKKSAGSTRRRPPQVEDARTFITRMDWVSIFLTIRFDVPP